MVTLAGAELACASVTTSEKARVAAAEPAGTTGAVNVRCAVLDPASETAAPELCVQAKLIASPSGSALALPSSETAAPEATAWSGPAFAIGAGFGGGSALTVICTVEGAELAFRSLTTSEKVRIAGAWPKGTAGAVKVGVAELALESVTIGPAVCVHLNVKARPAGSLEALPSRVTK